MTFPLSHFKTFPAIAWCIALAGLNCAVPAAAESPMHTDDAGTLAQGTMKLEAVAFRDDKTRGVDLVVGAGVLPGLEMEAVLGRAKDRQYEPATTYRGLGFGLKWVPLQSDTGWSAGGRLDWGRTRVRDDATPGRWTEREFALTALATYRLASGQALHLNAGRKVVKAQGTSQSAATWAAGYEWPLAQQLQATAEVYGEQRSRPDKALGLRYEIAEGLKVSVAAGRGNGRTFGQVGMAWEF